MALKRVLIIIVTRLSANVMKKIKEKRFELSITENLYLNFRATKT